MKAKVCSVLLLLTTLGLTFGCSRQEQPNASPLPTATSAPTTAPPTTQASVPPTEEATPTPTAESSPSPPPMTPSPMPDEPSLEILVPDGGEVWLEGSTQTIVWHSSGVDAVDIEIATGGKPLGHVALGVPAASGEVAWDIPVGLVSNFGVVESDAMRMRISSSEDPGVSDENDVPFKVQCPRIRFEPGAISTTVTGTLTSDSTYRYALGASAEQTLELEASPPVLEVEITGVSDGSAWQLPAAERRITIPSLPASQDYFITLTTGSFDEDEMVEYTLDITIY